MNLAVVIALTSVAIIFSATLTTAIVTMNPWWAIAAFLLAAGTLGVIFHVLG